MARNYDTTKTPILNNPYEEPRLYYDTDMEGNLANNLSPYGRWAFVEISDIDNIKRILIRKKRNYKYEPERSITTV